VGTRIRSGCQTANLRGDRRVNMPAIDRASDYVTAVAARFRKELFEADFARSREVHEALEVGCRDYLADALLSPF
jgi:hypothetical protein